MSSSLMLPEKVHAVYLRNDVVHASRRPCLLIQLKEPGTLVGKQVGKTRLCQKANNATCSRH